MRKGFAACITCAVLNVMRIRAAILVLELTEAFSGAAMKPNAFRARRFPASILPGSPLEPCHLASCDRSEQ